MARTVLAGLFAIGLSAVAVPPAYAACDGYDEPLCVEVTISDITQIGGLNISVQGQARTSAGDPVDCSDLSIEFFGDSAPFVNGKNVSTSGSTFNHVFTTNKVPQDLTGFAVLTCTYDDSTLPTGSAVQQANSPNGQVNLLALDDSDNSDSDDSDSDDSDSDDSDDSDSDDSDDDGGLPDTGGERLLWLLIGLALVAGGTTIIVSSRDRDSAA